MILINKPAVKLGAMLVLLLGLAHGAWGADPAVEVRRMGLSRVGGNTLLTLVLDKAAEPRISCQTAAGKPQLVMNFPQGRAARLPSRLPGDDLLVQQVRSESASPGGGLRIILDLYPDKPYAYWRQIRPGPGGQSFFILGLKPDTRRAAVVQGQMAPVPPAPPIAGAPPAAGEFAEPAPESVPPEPRTEEYGVQERQSSTTPGSFAELRRMLPKADSLFQSLERDGWTVSNFNRYERPGQRLSRDFVLTNARYPELVINIVYLPANMPNTPNIGIVSLSTERLGGETAAQYQDLRKWSFARIKQKYEDIGDFFEDALKPLRVKLREQTKAVTLKYAQVFQNFLQQACPQNPGVAEKVMAHVREKVSPRFEGVQYTISENPLVTLNLVDFLYVKVYYVEDATGGAR